MNIFVEIKDSFTKGTILTKLIYTNLLVFFLLISTLAVLYLLNQNLSTFKSFFELPPSLLGFITHPWTLITYMFTHFSFLHILMNMLFLYWFGKVFLQYLTERQMLGLYLLGGLAGGLAFVLSYNTIPVLGNNPAITPATGASASVMAIIFAIVSLVPKHDVYVPILGKIKLLYIGLTAVAIDIISIPLQNTGGHIGHLGGAFIGIIFSLQYRKGKDIVSWLLKITDGIIIIFSKKKKIRVTSRNKNKASYSKYDDMEYNARKKADQDEINAILDKVARSGYGSLSASEKEKLFKMSSKK